MIVHCVNADGVAIGTDRRVIAAMFPQSKLDARNKFVRAIALAMIQGTLGPLNTPFADEDQKSLKPTTADNPLGLPK